MLTAASMPELPRSSTNLHALLLAIRDRHSSNPIDKVCAVAFPFQKRGDGNFRVTFPIYDPSTPVSVAWGRLISSIASARMEPGVCKDHLLTTTVQLLCLFPHPSKHHWFPSWAQVRQYPDVSIRDNDSIPVLRDMDYSLRIVSGRIYRGCSLELKHSPTSDGVAAYYCSMGMGHNIVELVATVPGVELDLDPRSRYVLVDISPEYSLCCMEHRCHEDMQGHVHEPIWERSVIIVCEEVDNLEHAQPVQATTYSPAIVRYRLRRVTTLYWIAQQQGCKDWLPFRPSLEHTTSVDCGGPKRVTSLSPPDTFCDPAAVAGLRTKNGRGERGSMCPAYEVYLV